MLTVKDWDEIRRKYFIEEKSINEIAGETGYAWRTIKRHVESDEPPKYKREQPYRARKIGPYKEKIEALLAQNKTLPRKQRWTSSRIFAEIQKDGYTGAESTLRHWVARVRRETKKPKLYLPLEFDPGTDAQVDWGEGEIILNGKQVTAQLFYMKLSYSRRSFMMAFPAQKQEAFFMGHVQAFSFFEGIPKRISYDNLKTAVRKVLEGKKRIEQDKFFHFRGYYLFESNYCTPGAGNEKGGVEHSVGYLRRQFMVPLPEVKSFDELNQYLLARCQADGHRQVSGQTKTIGEMWQQEKDMLRPLPAHPYDCCRTVTTTLNRYSQIQVETNRYSVPVDEAAKELTVKLYPFHLDIFKSGLRQPVATHVRAYGKGEEILDPLHYLPLLKYRPGAIDHAKPLREWKARWPPVYDALLEKLRSKHGSQGVKTFVNILFLHRQYSQKEMEKAIQTALEMGTLTQETVQLYLTQNRFAPTMPDSLTISASNGLAHMGQQPLNLAAYDSFLGGSG